MTELTFTILKYGFLILLWVFVAFAVRSLHRDVMAFSPKSSKKHRKRERLTRKAAQKPAVRQQPAPAPIRPRTTEQPTLLVIIDGPLAGTTVPLHNGQITLGRAPGNSVVLDDEFVSSHHARIFQDPSSGRWAIEDLGSTNGTVVNSKRISGATVLPARVPVRIGATTFELR